MTNDKHEGFLQPDSSQKRHFVSSPSPRRGTIFDRPKDTSLRMTYNRFGTSLDEL